MLILTAKLKNKLNQRMSSDLANSMALYKLVNSVTLYKLANSVTLYNIYL